MRKFGILLVFVILALFGCSANSSDDDDDAQTCYEPPEYIISDECCAQAIYGGELSTYVFPLDCGIEEVEPGTILIGECMLRNTILVKKTKEEDCWILETERYESECDDGLIHAE